MHLFDLLDSHSALGAMAQTLAQTPSLARLSGVPSPAWGVIAGDLAARTKRTLLLIAPNGETAEQCANDLRALFDADEASAPDVLLFPIARRVGLEEVAGDTGATQERLAVLEAVHNDKIVVVVATVNALAHPTLPPDELRHGYDQIVLHQTLKRDEFIAHLSGTGYERVEQVEAPGQFAVRGGLIDFFPPAAQSGLRVELFGDEVDSLRTFDVETQRSTEKVQFIRLTPPREVYLTPARGQAITEPLRTLLKQAKAQLEDRGNHDAAAALAESVARDIHRLEEGVYFAGLDRYRALLYPQRPTLFEHLPANALVVWADPARCRSQIERLIEEDRTVREAAIENGAMLPLPEALCHFDELCERSRRFASAEVFVGEQAADSDLNSPATDDGSLDIHLPPAFGGKLDACLDWVKSWQNKGGIVVFSTAHARRVREILADGDVHHVHLLDAINQLQPSLALLMPHRLTAGFFLKDEGQPAASLAIITDSEMFGWNATQPRLLNKRRGAKRSERKFNEQSRALTQIADLREGDFVVHINHGVARYAGVARREVAGAVNDYLLLEYEGKDRLYVPVGQLDRVQKYLGAEAVVPPLNSLSGNAWERTKKRVREETVQAAKQLAELYAAREQARKEPIGPDTPWQREMESAFPYEETEGQLQAIKDTKADLQSTRPMDRLICGDVGYGKTEVAVRAAFKVVQDGKQVAILVPTTVLAQQHYQTFSERLAPYPTRVEVLSRFRTPAEQKRVAEDTRLGAVDILIGTHRLLQSDVKFRDLGLVIVDEEQRFGVMHKEKLKDMRREVDMMTLSATPIPRTLQFALSGMREISLITDPPRGRLPVRTVVMPYKDEVVRQSIERELEREGQIYYVHNRVSSIHHIAEHVRQLVPHARIGVGHGQMNDEDLEQVMLDFMHHRTDVLISTTIIENGLDLPNVNTLIVDRAELLGLSQMYQLRGRVGRSNRQGFAYFFSGSRGKLGETAETRFAAIQEHTDLGAGFKIAMRDLEIRGAGDVLGIKQSGSISAVGFEMYTEMLSEAIRRLKKVPIQHREELPEADLPIPAFLPSEYIPQERDRLNLYRKATSIQSVEDAKALQDELRDRFGPLPTPAMNLIRILKVRVHLLHARLGGISKTESEVLIRLKPGDLFAPEDTAAVQARLRKENAQRTLQHISERKREGLAVDTRVLSATQALRMVEVICETLANVRGERLMGGG